MHRYLIAAIASSVLLSTSTAQGRVFSEPGWYLMIGAGTQSDPKKPIKGPYSTRPDCLNELDEWLEMTDGTEALECNYLHESPEEDTLEAS